MTCLRFSLVLTFVLMFSTASYASVPYLISYQGRLADAGGNPLAEGARVAITFSIYDAPSAGLLLWSEPESVTVAKDGQFRVFLGSVFPLTDDVFSGPDRFLAMSVNSDPEMTPRVRLASSPFAIRIGSVDGAKGGNIAGLVSIGSAPLKSQLTLGGGLDLPFTTSFPEDNTGGIRWMNGFDSHTAFGLFVHSGLWFQGDGNLANGAFGVRYPTSDGALGNIAFVVRPNGNVGVGTEFPGTRLHVAGRTLFNQGYSYGLCVSDSADPAMRLNLGFDKDLNAGVIQSSHDFVTWNRNLLLNPNGGYVGVGTTVPEQPLHVMKGSAGTVTSDVNSIAVLENSTNGYLSILAPSGSERGVLFGDNLHPEDGGIVYVGASNRLEFRTNGNATRMWIDEGGKVLIPGGSFYVTAQTSYDNLNTYGINVGDLITPSKKVSLGYDATLDAGVIQGSSQGSFSRSLLLNPRGGRIGIGNQYPQHELDVVGSINCSNTIFTTAFEVSGNTTTQGRTKTGTLEITGGADLAEPFAITDDKEITAGAVVVIDDEHPGQLKLSHVPYDGRVAGVVSGAGGINPGLTLMQSGALDAGQNVALSGRVYVLATAANGSIKPGDLLTTSDVPGHAMKASDRELSQGAVLGKAMTGLDSGEGLIMVLVNLQ